MASYSAEADLIVAGAEIIATMNADPWLDVCSFDVYSEAVRDFNDFTRLGGYGREIYSAWDDRNSAS